MTLEPHHFLHLKCDRLTSSEEARSAVSKDEDERLRARSCFETHRSAVRQWKDLRSRRAAMLLSMRAMWGGVKHTNFRLQEIAAGFRCLFPACSLQGTVQLRRVRPQMQMAP
jgi:hypothetical protein